MNELLHVRELTPEAAKLLIAAGADVNHIDQNKNTPIINACMYNNTKVAKFLIEAGADVDSENKDKNNSIYFACYNKNYELVKLLIEAGVDKLSIYYWDTTEEIKKILVQSGYVTSNDFIIKYGTEEQKTKIVVTFEEACKSLEFTKIYIDQGGDINKQNNYGNTLLHYAAVKEKDLEWVKFLVDKGAYQKIKNVYGEVPARMFSSDEIHFILKENINEPDNDGNTILHKYAENNNIEKIKYLIKIGARFDIKNNKGKTAYDLAKDKTIFKTKEELLKELVGDDIKWAIETLIKNI